jgi:hypothetical protein
LVVVCGCSFGCSLAGLLSFFWCSFGVLLAVLLVVVLCTRKTALRLARPAPGTTMLTRMRR